MSSIYLTIVPAKVLKNGKHNIRIAVSHNSITRFIPTGIIVEENEFKEGRVVKRPDKELLNANLRGMLQSYEEKIMRIQYADTLTCSQLVEQIKSDYTQSRRRTFNDITEEYLMQIDEADREKSYKLYRLAANRYMSFAGSTTLMESITPLRINNYIMYLKKEKLSSTTINIYITLLKVIINYAIKMKYVTFEVDPFITARVPQAKKRDTYITVEQLKKIRDADIKEKSVSIVRDIFMLTYYLAGMNLVDLLAYDFRNTDDIYYVRKKTRNTKDGDSATHFSIAKEAKPIIEKYMCKSTGRLVFGHYKNYTSCYNVLARKIKELASIGGIKHDFTLYSARKSFVQHGFDLGIPLSTLEYCIGQSMKDSRPIFNYVKIMKKHADKAIREILDNLK